MKGDVDVVYRVPKDLVWRYLRDHVYDDFVKFAMLKACVDESITVKTIRKVLPLLETGGTIAIWCNWHNLSQVVRFCDHEELAQDVVLFHEDRLEGRAMCTTYDAVIPFVLIHRDRPLVSKRVSNLMRLETDQHLEEVTSKFIMRFTKNRDAVLFAGDALLTAPLARRLGRHVIAFGDDKLSVEALFNETLVEGRLEFP